MKNGFDKFKFNVNNSWVKLDKEKIISLIQSGVIDPTDLVEYDGEKCQFNKFKILMRLWGQLPQPSQLDKSAQQGEIKSEGDLEKEIGDGTLLIKCESCSRLFSKRASNCPKCGWGPLVTCQVCQQKIPYDSTSCPECGDPVPFAEKITTQNPTKEQLNIETTASTAFQSSQHQILHKQNTNCHSFQFTWGWFLFSFEGRVNRQLYWINYSLYTGIISFIFAFLLSKVFVYSQLGENGELAFMWLVGLYYFFLMWIYLAVSVKRWHDRDKSGWMVLINFIPVLFIWAIIENGFLRGTEGNNRFGVDPLGKERYA